MWTAATCIWTGRWCGSKRKGEWENGGEGEWVAKTTRSGVACYAVPGNTTGFLNRGIDESKMIMTIVPDGFCSRLAEGCAQLHPRLRCATAPAELKKRRRRESQP